MITDLRKYLPTMMTLPGLSAGMPGPKMKNIFVSIPSLPASLIWTEARCVYPTDSPVEHLTGKWPYLNPVIADFLPKDHHLISLVDDRRKSGSKDR
jgi:hypothetical protein